MDAMKPQSTKPLAIEGYARDENLVREGAVVTLGSNPDGSQRWIRVRPINSHHYEDRLQARLKAFSRATLNSDPEIERRVQKDVAAEAIVFVEHGNFYPAGSFEPNGDGGFKLREGAEPFPNDYETRRAMLEDRDFFVDFIQAAGLPETFRRQQMEADLGNSPASSNGS